MAARRNYIDNQKVSALFDELKIENRLCEKNFIEAFKQKFPQDYERLQNEWEVKKREFRKNRKGNPKPFPIRPEKTLKGIYRSYYFELIKYPAIKKRKQEEFNNICAKAGRYGCKINRIGNSKKYNVVSKKDNKILYENYSIVDLKNLFFSKRGIKNLLKTYGEKEDK